MTNKSQPALVSSIDTFLTVVFGVCVFLMPLQNVFISFFVGEDSTWNNWNIWLVLFITVGYATVLYSRKIYLNKTIVLSSLVGMILLLLESLLALYPVPLSSLIPFLIVLASLPLLHILTKDHRGDITMYVGIAVLLLHAQWAIAQFIMQHSVGILGEPYLQVGIPGVATFTSFGEKLLRAYGPYPHPNIFAGVLALSVPSLFLFSQRLSSTTSRIIFLIPLCILGTALLLTFSRTAALSVLITMICFFLLYRPKFRFSDLIIPFITLTLLFAPLYVSRTTDPADEAISFRTRTSNWYLNILREHSSLFGVGYNNYSTIVTEYLTVHNISFYSWEIAPLHFVPGLIILEFGYVGFTLFLALTLFFFLYSFPLRLLLLASFPLILFDHYLYTYNISLFWFVFYIFILSNRRFSYSSLK